MEQHEGEAEWERVGRESLAAIEVALRQREVVPRVRERLEMVKGVALGQPVAAVARWSGRTEGTVQRWVSAFVVGGIAAVADAPRSGRPPRADGAYLAALERAADTAPRALELLFDVWTSGRLRAYLAETTGIRIAPGWIRALLARQRFRCGRPKHTLEHLQNPAAEAACEAVLQAMKKKGGGRRDHLRVPLPG